jgi:hypothetical protein
LSAAKSNVVEVKAMLQDMAAEAADLKQAAGGSVTDSVAGWLAPQYALAARKQLSTASDPEHLQILRTFVQDWTMLRRGDHSAARLQLDREKLELELKKHSDAMAQAQKEIQKLRDVKAPLSDADRLAIVDKIDEIMGIPKGKY